MDSYIAGCMDTWQLLMRVALQDYFWMVELIQSEHLQLNHLVSVKQC